jgi:6-phosphogluconate dehydrogenase
MVCTVAQDWCIDIQHIDQGQNLILNMNDKGFNVVAYNRTTSKIDDFLAKEAKGKYQSI